MESPHFGAGFSLENRGARKKDMDYRAELCYNENDFGPFLILIFNRKL